MLYSLFWLFFLLPASSYQGDVAHLDVYPFVLLKTDVGPFVYAKQICDPMGVYLRLYRFDGTEMLSFFYPVLVLDGDNHNIAHF